MKRLKNFLELFYAKTIFTLKRWFLKSKQMQELQKSIGNLFNTKATCFPICNDGIVTAIHCDINFTVFIVGITFGIAGSSIRTNIDIIQPSNIPADATKDFMNTLYSPQTQNAIYQLIKPYIGKTC